MGTFDLAFRSALLKARIFFQRNELNVINIQEMNMFNKSITERKTDIPAVWMKRLFVILGFLYLIAIPSGALGEKRKLEPVDIGVLLIVLVVNSDISLKETMERLSSVKVTATSFEAELKEKIEKEVSVKVDEKDKADAEAKKLVDLQLSETPPSGIKQELRDKIALASSSTIETIYKMAKDARRNGQHKKGIIERTIPVFRALTESEYGKNRCQFYAQLGYALKDQETPDWKGARDNLDTAIKLWRGKHPISPLPSLYCFNWVICMAELDEQSILQQQEIDERIRAATICETLYRAIFDNNQFRCWVAKHQGGKFTAWPEFENLSGHCRKNYDEREKQLSKV
ncbi:hypothetical protein [Stenomitos frigidus]|uniref:hypothetical protein n=1 Tax=Stenomitos frigidus TaxID=1886765 RepID=UPI0011B27732|nr:hypothetical protein [Stenomitos frigidus]